MKKLLCLFLAALLLLSISSCGAEQENPLAGKFAVGYGRADGEPSSKSTETGINSYKREDRSPKRQKIPLDLHSRWKSRGFTCSGQDVLTKKETAFRLSLWWARRDLNPHVRSEH